MIRDFAGIVDSTLNREIAKLRKAFENHTVPREVSLESIEVIDQIRGVGNIGAHMEKDIDTIIDVDPDEAELLLSLVEMLVKEWYVARDERQRMLAEMKAMADRKEQARKGLPPGEIAAEDC